MIASILFLWSLAVAARAQAPSADGAQEPWLMANISVSIVDYHTPRQDMQIGFVLDYPNRQQYFNGHCSLGPSTGPHASWKPCSYDFLHVKTTNLEVTSKVDFDIHFMKYGSNKDTSKNNTKQLAEVYLDYAKTTIVGNSTDNDNILDCKLRRQDKDLKCRGAGVKSQPVKLYPKRTKAVIRPLTVRNITLSGPYPNNEQHCSILFDVVNPNPDALTSFNAESEPQLLRNKKRDFGVCQYSFPCGSRGSDSSSGHPRCSNDFGHDLNWRFSINDLGILDLYWTISKGHNVTIAAIDTRWSSNLRADRHECGKTCVIDCGSEGCGKCSNGVCSWGGFDRMVDDLTITPRYKWPNI